MDVLVVIIALVLIAGFLYVMTHYGDPPAFS